MRHFPIFLDLRGHRIAVAGGGEIAVAKLRLLMKTEARITVHAAEVVDDIRRWEAAGRLRWRPADFAHEDAICTRLVYGASGDPLEDARVKAIAEPAGALVNIVDDLEASAFITPAIVDRDPVVVAVGTEGAAPVLARRIKAQNEERLDPQLGILARHAAAKRKAVEALPHGQPRRMFWTRYFDEMGPAAMRHGGEDAVDAALDSMLEDALAATPPTTGKVILVGAGPGDPELLTLKARRLLHEADVVVYDRLVGAGILELARREATLIEVGKVPGGPSWRQDDINALMIDHARSGSTVVRLKSGDPLVFGRADEEIDALDTAGIAVEVVPGVTSAAAAAAGLERSLTRRGRNQALTLMTAHDAKGFAEQDWRSLAKPDAVAAVYMGVRAATFLRGRLLLHGAEPGRPVTVVENASRIDERRVQTTLAELPEALTAAGIEGPAIIFLGLAPRDAVRQAARAEACA
ncbi:MAG: siroheme synthase CysG [Pseudomonadota bacterium]